LLTPGEINNRFTSAEGNSYGLKQDVGLWHFQNAFGKGGDEMGRST